MTMPHQNLIHTQVLMLLILFRLRLVSHRLRRVWYKAKQFKLKEEKAAAKALADKLATLTVKITASSGGDGRLYGSITSKDIAEKLKEQHKIEIDKRKLVLQDNIKSYGTYEVEVKVYPEITSKLKVTVSEGK